MVYWIEDKNSFGLVYPVGMRFCNWINVKMLNGCNKQHGSEFSSHFITTEHWAVPSASSLRRTAARRREEIKECLTTVKQVFFFIQKCYLSE